MMKQLKTLVIAVIAFFGTQTMIAQAKVAHVDVNELMSKMPAMLDAQNQLKKHEESDAAYDKSLEYNPTNVFVLNNYAYFLSLRNTNLEKAETMSKKANSLEPNSSTFQDTYGWILYQMKKYDDAKVAIEWPLPVSLVSDKDLAIPLIDASFTGATL